MMKNTKKIQVQSILALYQILRDNPDDRLE